MQILMFPTSYPFLFWMIALIWSGIQFYAGFNYGTYIYDHAPKNHNRERCKRILAYGVHHGALYLICSLAGFVSWLFLDLLSKCIRNWGELDAGIGAILLALFLFSIICISGALPRILYLGKYPR